MAGRGEFVTSTAEKATAIMHGGWRHRGPENVVSVGRRFGLSQVSESKPGAPQFVLLLEFSRQSFAALIVHNTISLLRMTGFCIAVGTNVFHGDNH